MARISKNRILGSLKDITIYEVDGRIVVARKGGYTKKKYHESENLEGHRKRGTEFKFSSHLAKMIRHSLNEYRYMFKTRLCGNLTKQMQLVCKNDLEGSLGERRLDIKSNGKLLEEFDFSKVPFNSLSQLPVILNIDFDRKSIRLSIPAFHPLVKMSPPAGTNSFKLFMTATLVNSFIFNQVKQSYIPEFSKGYSLTKNVESALFNNAEPVNAHLLEVDFGFLPENGHGLIICLGIEFFDSFTSRINNNKDWAAMKILKVA